MGALSFAAVSSAHASSATTTRLLLDVRIESNRAPLEPRPQRTRTRTQTRTQTWIPKSVSLAPAPLLDPNRRPTWSLKRIDTGSNRSKQNKNRATNSQALLPAHPALQTWIDLRSQGRRIIKRMRSRIPINPCVSIRSGGLMVFEGHWRQRATQTILRPVFSLRSPSLHIKQRF